MKFPGRYSVGSSEFSRTMNTVVADRRLNLVATPARTRMKSRRPLVDAALLVAAVAILLALPDVRGLGGLVKIVYVHAALFFGGLILIGRAVALGAAAAVSSRRPPLATYARADAAYLVGMGSLVVTLIVGGILAKVAWGDFLWSEPRFAFLETTTALGAIVLAAKHFLSAPRPVLLAGQALQLAYAVYKLFTVESFFHPRNPIYGGEPIVWIGYSAFFLLVTILLARLSLALRIQRLPREHEVPNGIAPHA